MKLGCVIHNMLSVANMCAQDIVWEDSNKYVFVVPPGMTKKTGLDVVTMKYNGLVVMKCDNRQPIRIPHMVLISQKNKLTFYDREFLVGQKIEGSNSNNIGHGDIQIHNCLPRPIIVKSDTLFFLPCGKSVIAAGNRLLVLDGNIIFIANVLYPTCFSHWDGRGNLSFY